MSWECSKCGKPEPEVERVKFRGQHCKACHREYMKGFYQRKKEERVVSEVRSWDESLSNRMLRAGF